MIVYAATLTFIVFIGFVIGGPRVACIGLISIVLGFLVRRYIDGAPPWRF